MSAATSNPNLDPILETYRSRGLAEAIAAIRSRQNPLEAGAMFNAFLQHLYGVQKNVAEMIDVGDSGVAFCLGSAKRAQNSEDAKKLKETAKTIAFNTAANCWPGWGDEGVKIEPAHVQAGLRLAEMQRALVSELALGPTSESTAHWIVGALRLAAGRANDAFADFECARRASEAAEHQVGRLAQLGYAALARKAVPATSPEGARELAQALKQLQDEGSKEAKFFAQQIVTAEKILFPAVG